MSRGALLGRLGGTGNEGLDPGYQVHNVLHPRFGDGSGASLQNAIDLASADGGGMVLVPRGTYTLLRTLTLKPDVCLWGQPGATLGWGGAATGTLFAFAGTDPVQRWGMIGNGARIDVGAGCAYVWNLKSPQFGVIDGFQIDNGSATMVVCRVSADATNASGYNSKRNAVRNRIGGLTATGAIGTMLELDGDPAGVTGVVTLNAFHDLEASSCQSKFIRLANGCDSNEFYGTIRAQLAASNAIGVVANDGADVTANNAVYNNNFRRLEVDTFSGGGLTGRVALQLNNTKQMVVETLYNSPAAEGGDLVVIASTVSYWVGIVGQGGNNNIHVRSRGYKWENDLELGLEAHLLSSGTAPAIAAGAAGDATATVALAAGSTDLRGTISVTAAGTPLTNGLICTVTFNKAFSTAPFVLIAEANSNTSGVAVGKRALIDRSLGDVTVNGFSLRSGASTALSAGTTYSWHYWVIG